MSAAPSHPESSQGQHDTAFAASGDVAPRDLVRVIGRHLRGRVGLGLLVGAILSASAMVLSLRLFEPEWESRGIIRVSSTEPKILQGIPAWAPIPEFTSFVSMQASLLESREILESATRRLVTHSSGWPSGEAGIMELEDSIQVNHRAGRQAIELIVRHHDAQRAQVACEATMAALVDQREESSRAQHNMMVGQLEDQRAALMARREQSRREQRAIAPLYDATVIQRQYVAMVDELRVVEDRIAAMVARYDAEADAHASINLDAPRAQRHLDPSLAQDPELVELRRIEHRFRAQLENLDPRMDEQHPVARQLQTELARVESMIKYRTAELLLDESQDDHPDSVVDRLLEHRDRLSAEIAQVREQKDAMASLQKEEMHLTARLQEIELRLESMSVEQQTPLGDRVHIASHASMPLRPSSHRGLRMAAVGGVAAFMFPFVCIVVFGLIENRIRYVEAMQATDSSVPVLGVVPTHHDKSTLADLRLVQMGLEDIRQRLESELRRRSGRVLAIVSPRSGDGRTTLCLSLGKTLATAASSTIVVDADVVRGGLSKSLELDDQQGLADALTKMRSGGAKSPRLDVKETETPSLQAVGAGSNAAIGTLRSLEPARVQSILESKRATCDTMLVDTGPYLESVDVDAAVGAADAVVVIVRRRTRVRDVQVMLQELRSRDVDIVGLILNEADRADCRSLRDMVSRVVERGGSEMGVASRDDQERAAEHMRRAA